MESRDYEIQPGWTAHDRNGAKIGDVEEVAPNYILVTKGLIFTTDLYVPRSAITEVDADEGSILFDVDKSRVEDQGWNEPPRPDASGQGPSAGTMAAAGGGATTSTSDVGSAGGMRVEATADAGSELRDAATPATQATNLDDEERAPGDDALHG